MEAAEGSAFHGVPAAALEAALVACPRRRFGSGETLIREGEERPADILLIERGTVEIAIADPAGGERVLTCVGPGTTLGEMALFTGRPASATARAAGEVVVRAVDAATLHALAAAFPRVYLNLGVMLAERLAETNRQTIEPPRGRVAWLDARGTSSEAGYALAASVAWHARRPVLHLLIDPPEGGALVASAVRAPDAAADVAGFARARRRDRAALLLAAPSTGAFAPQSLPLTLERLAAEYAVVLVESASPPAAATAERLRLPRPGADDAGGRVARVAVAGQRAGAASAIGDIPALSATERAALAEGVLPPAGAAGRSLGRVAREVAGLRVGVALGAGAVKGYAHVGVLRALEVIGVPVDVIAGTSIGAAVATIRAAGFGAERAAAILDAVGRAAFRPAVPRHALLSSAGLETEIRRFTGDARIERLGMPLAIVAADLVTHREVVFRSGKLWPALLASMAIPGIYPPRRMGRSLLVDGGIIDPVPVGVAAELGADVVIGVRLGTPPGAPGGAAPAPPSVIQAVARTIEVMQTRITDFTTAGATVLLEPAFRPDEGWGLRNFSAGRRFIPLGEEAVRQAMPRLAAALPWLG